MMINHSNKGGKIKMETYKNCKEYLLSLTFDIEDNWNETICFDALIKNDSDYGLRQIEPHIFQEVTGNMIKIKTLDDIFESIKIR
jgi:hypothetical protein